MKKIIALVLAMLMALSLVACGNTAGQDEAGGDTAEHLMSSPLTLKVSYTENPDTAIGTVMPAAFEKITEMTNGDLKFEIYPSSQLGTNADVLEQIANGAPIIQTAGYDNMAAYCDSCVPLAIPYVFQNTDEVIAFANTEYFEKVVADLTNVGYVPLCSGTLGVRHFISTKPITCADDIKGMIVRMGASNPCQSFVTVMGGTPTTTAWADNYSMLQSGAIEACEASIDLLWSSSLYEVCDYLCLSGHLSTPFMFVMSPTFYDQIPAEYQEIMKSVLNDACAEVATKLNTDAATYVQKFKDAGVTVCEDPDINSFTAVLPDLFDYLKIEQSVYTDIRAAIEGAM